MSVLFYRIAHRFRVTPWERLARLPASRQLFALLDLAESELQPPFGSALDLGCGTGNWARQLAARGWDVTGIDIAPNAVRIARERARNAGHEVRFPRGDVSALQAAGVGSGFRLVLDIGTIHGLDPAQRAAAGREVTAVTVSGATLIMYAFAPARRGPLPHGMSRAEIESTYRGWTLVDEIAFDMAEMPESVRKDDPHWYRLMRD